MNSIAGSCPRLAQVAVIVGIIFCCVFFASTSQATVYNVGPGQTYTTIGAVPWESLAAGDTVNIYYQATPYYEKVDIGVVGTPANPVTINGVPDSSGDLPIIDGNN